MIRQALNVAAIAGFAITACAATSSKTTTPPEGGYVLYRAEQLKLNDKQAEAYRLLADAIWGDNAQLVELCIARGKDGLVAKAAGVKAVAQLPDENAQVVGRVRDGKVILFQTEQPKTAQQAPLKQPKKG